ncbi:MAG: DUF1444 family protein, partial [Verrucomicrobiae bacterium]|nr:DUF1444 family protein [Verrucomicrobiae bacterium]
SGPESGLSPGDFTDLYLAYLKQAAPNASFERLGDLELKVRMEDGSSHSVFLDNAFNQYENDPQQRDEILETYISSFLEVTSHREAAIDPKRIVPVIKDRGWLEGIQETLRERGGESDDLPAYVCDPYNSELTIFYAEDSPKNIRYLTEEAFGKLGIDRESLPTLALENLLGLIGEIEVMGGDGLYMITAGGDYEASLLLVDQVWNPEAMPVDGDYIAAIPARDLLIVTGSENAEAIGRLREMAGESAASFSYPLTPVLFIRRNGVFEVFEG